MSATEEGTGEGASPDAAVEAEESSTKQALVAEELTVAQSPMTRVDVPLMGPTEAGLLQTLVDINARSEVQACMNSMLMDVETAYYLQQKLTVQANQHAMNSLTKEHKATVLEADAERKARDTLQLELADNMVQELMTLSKELEDLLHWKQTHEHKVEDYDTLVAKLAQTEEELVEAQRIQYSGQPKPRQPESPPSKSKPAFDTPQTEAEPPLEASSKEEAETSSIVTESAPPAISTTPVQTPAVDLENSKPTALELDTSNPPKDATPEPASTTEAVSPAVEDAKPAPPTATSTLNTTESATVVDIPGLSEEPPVSTTEAAAAATETAAAETTPSTEKKPSEDAAAVVMLDIEEPEEVPGLVEMDVEILMTVFGFLDAIDILNMAQINITMYSRIDNIFGISEDGQTPPEPARPTPTAPTPAPAAAPPQTTAQPTPPAAAAKKPQLSPTLGAASPGALGNRFFSMLQPARPAQGGAAGAGAVKKSGPAMNPSVAQSMASKLSDSELAAIISMTDKLNKLDKEVNLLRNEKEALSAKLDGTEAVKQFLINKVRDVEIKLTQSRDDEIKVTQQIASDQEVIAFLDTRVQEVERQTENLTTSKAKAQSELESIKVQTSKKISMLSDMLKYEREKFKEDEGEWKATKKVLVKEVKACRAQILALQAERDGFREQNEMLKRAIGAKGGMSSPLR